MLTYAIQPAHFCKITSKQIPHSCAIKLHNEVAIHFLFLIFKKLHTVYLHIFSREVLLRSQDYFNLL